MKIPKKGTLVLVEWHDAHSHSRWQSMETSKVECRPLVCHSAGIIIENENKYVSVAGTVSFDGKGVLDAFTDIMVIPEGMIQKIKRLVPKRG